MEISERIYFDSCCFIDAAKYSEADDTDEPERGREVWYIKTALTAAMGHDMSIYTSSISIAECTHTES